MLLAEDQKQAAKCMILIVCKKKKTTHEDERATEIDRLYWCYDIFCYLSKRHQSQVSTIWLGVWKITCSTLSHRWLICIYDNSNRVYCYYNYHLETLQPEDCTPQWLAIYIYIYRYIAILNEVIYNHFYRIMRLDSSMRIITKVLTTGHKSCMSFN